MDEQRFTAKTDAAPKGSLAPYPSSPTIRNLSVEAGASEGQSLAALRRSAARRGVLSYLVRANRPVSTSVIAREARFDFPAVVGALRGLGMRYSADWSLVGLGLVKEVPVPSKAGNTRTYEPTLAGRAAWHAFENDGFKERDRL